MSGKDKAIPNDREAETRNERNMLNEFPIFDYEDIQLIPNKCVLQSRAEADTHVTLGNHTFKLPVVPSNMQTILDEDVAEQLAKGGYFYIMHRFDEAGRIPFVNACMKRVDCFYLCWC